MMRQNPGDEITIHSPFLLFEYVVHGDVFYAVLQIRVNPSQEFDFHVVANNLTWETANILLMQIGALPKGE